MINLLFVLPWLGIGGSEHVVLELARGLDKSRFRPIIFAIKPGPMETKFRQQKLRTIISKKEPGKGHLQLMAHIHSTIEKFKIDIVLPHHMTSLFYSFFPARICNSTRLYFTEHSVSDIESLSFSFRLLAVIMLSLSSGCIAISREISASYSKSLMVRSSKIVNIPNCIDVDRFEKPVDKISKKISLGIEPNNLIIGTVANIKAVKNHRNLLFAFEKLRKQMKDVTLILVGSGPLDDQIRRLTSELGLSENVVFLGHRSDIAELYQIFDIFCLSSFSEGFPLSILEAMACEVPVVATNVSGINEIIQSGINGILVPSDNSNTLAGALVMLAQNAILRQTVAKKGFATLSEKYAYHNWIKKYEMLFA